MAYTDEFTKENFFALRRLNTNKDIRAAFYYAAREDSTYNENNFMDGRASNVNSLFQELSSNHSPEEKEIFFQQWLKDLGGCRFHSNAERLKVWCGGRSYAALILAGTGIGAVLAWDDLIYDDREADEHVRLNLQGQLGVCLVFATVFMCVCAPFKCNLGDIKFSFKEAVLLHYINTEMNLSDDAVTGLNFLINKNSPALKQVLWDHLQKGALLEVSIDELLEADKVFANQVDDKKPLIMQHQCLVYGASEGGAADPEGVVKGLPG